MLPKPWPSKPPKGQRCDATAGTGSDLVGQPVVFRCPALAVETLVALAGARVFQEAWVCAGHVEAYVGHGYARNPRLYPTG